MNEKERQRDTKGRCKTTYEIAREKKKETKNRYKEK